MGTYYYIKVDELKALFNLGKYSLHDLDMFEKHWNKLLNILEEEFNYEMLEQEYSKLTVKDLMVLARIANEASMLEDYPYANMLGYILKVFKVKYEAVSEYDIDVEDLKKKGYKEYNIWEAEE